MPKTPETYGKFATCLNCIDGRIHLPVLQWIFNNYNIPFVDMITEPGIINILAQEGPLFDSVLEKVKISLNIHNSKIIFIAGHDDCAGNPQSPKIQENQIKRSTEILKNMINKIDPSCQIVGLWVPLDKDFFYDSSLEERYHEKNLENVDLSKNIKIISELY